MHYTISETSFWCTKEQQRVPQAMPLTAAEWAQHGHTSSPAPFLLRGSLLCNGLQLLPHRPQVPHSPNLQVGHGSDDIVQVTAEHIFLQNRTRMQVPTRHDKQLSLLANGIEL